MTSPETDRPEAATPGQTSTDVPSLPAPAGQSKPGGGSPRFYARVQADQVRLMPISELVTREPFKRLWATEKKPDNCSHIDLHNHMKSHGFGEAFPIVAWPHQTWGNVVVDGHTRLERAGCLGITEVPVVLMHFRDQQQALEFAFHVQKSRRNITPAAILRCVKLQGSRGRGRPSGNTAAAAISAPPTDAETARALGVSTDTVQRARTVAKHGTLRIQQAVEDGKLSIAAAYEQTQQQRRSASHPATAPTTPPAPEPAQVPGAPPTPPQEPWDGLDTAPEGPVGRGSENGELPCPFCGSQDLIYYCRSIRCKACHASGPKSEGRRWAGTLWNKALRRPANTKPGDFQGQLEITARTRPKADWPAIATAMEKAAAQLRAEATAEGGPAGA